MHYYFGHSLFAWAIKDGASRYVYANPRACGYFNVDASKLPGHLDTDLTPDIGDDYRYILSDDAKILSTGEMSVVLKTFRYGQQDNLTSFVVEKRRWRLADGQYGIACTYMQISNIYLSTFLNQQGRKPLVFTRPTDRFTDREWEVILLLFCGLKSSTMTQILGIGGSSLRNRLARCFDKSGVTSTTLFIRYCQQNGWDNYIPPFFLKKGHVMLS
ncbi:LuxR family transcriptional regulator [Erwinia psidii]|uniref:LuxR family transcriptional regulator n=2 Tax=Erwinia psidii TaxID=69224 RepID=A0A3N6TWU7_9GAMM|nr:LuxR family transcriptional regulator [Erwinia psidii]MCX8960524.1 LuxR family transcriptional regulator [Erwinia psidii]MCX8964231.1 LuxR family transcriptional regulator [Erwinia psidii]RQM39742.1 LuxR family transcriptional regulator [Erwinia psidii]